MMRCQTFVVAEPGPSTLIKDTVSFFLQQQKTIKAMRMMMSKTPPPIQRPITASMGSNCNIHTVFVRIYFVNNVPTVSPHTGGGANVSLSLVILK